MRMESIDDTPEEGGHISPAILRDWREVPSEALAARGGSRDAAEGDYKPPGHLS